MPQTEPFRWSGRIRYSANPEDDRRGDGAVSGTHSTGPTDCSPRHLCGGAGYDSRCGWCWLGASHTEDEHRRGVAR